MFFEMSVMRRVRPG